MRKNNYNAYFSCVLFPELRKAKVPSKFFSIIRDDIELRLNSYASILLDSEKRSVASEFVMEISENYQPSKLSLESRVVTALCIRNSILEEFHTDKPYLNSNSKIFIDDVKMKNIMKKSIRYFDKFKFTFDDVFNGIFDFEESHPLSFSYFSQLSKMDGGRSQVTLKPSHKPTCLYKRFIFIEDGVESNSENESGYDPRINGNMRRILESVSKNSGTLVLFPSFKHISRDINKALNIIEYILSNGCPIATGNYLFLNGEVFKRRNLLKPIHYNNDDSWYMNQEGLEDIHGKLLLNYAN